MRPSTIVYPDLTSPDNALMVKVSNRIAKVARSPQRRSSLALEHLLWACRKGDSIAGAIGKVYYDLMLDDCGCARHINVSL